MFKWQSISFLSRAIALLIGILQGALVVRMLSIEQWGSVQLILATVAIIGTSQALGLTSGTTREIVGAKNNAEAFRVFVTSLVLRMGISVPFLLVFYISASDLTKNIPGSIEAVWAIKVVILALLFDTCTGIFNSVISGFKKFKILFLYQVIRAVISFLSYVILTYLYSFRGFFYAFLVFNLLNFFALLLLSMKNFKRPLPSISFKNFKRHSLNIFGISLTVYLVKLMYSLWDNSGSIFLNRFLSISISDVAILSLALVYCKKLMVFSDSITDVTLPMMSKKYFESEDNFKVAYSKNFSATFVLISFFAVIAVLWSKEVVLLYTGKNNFLMSSLLIPFVMLGVWSYSKINLLKSSIFVPSKSLMSLIYVYASLLFFTYLAYYFLTWVLGFGAVITFSIAFGVGGLLSLVFGLTLIYKKLSIKLLGWLEYVYFLISVLIGSIYYLNLSFYPKLFFSVFALCIYLYYFVKLGLVKETYEKYKGSKKNIN